MLYAKHESNGLGSDNTVIFDDLKTVRGAWKRLLRGAWKPGRWNFYRCAKEDWYKETGHELVGVFDKPPGSPI